MANRPAHRVRLREHTYDLKVHITGPMLDEDKQMIGTMLIVEAEEKQEILKFIENDPYKIAGVYKQIDIRPFLWGINQPKETLYG